ncbi:hypothetical protein SMC26_23195 [Actinomadura fulvescens]|uniref:Uncharacterized protein n=1 Tax=Actinomadura fulvescens TaxID=46160 RepID=A0ABN3QXJ1_9ACTN
MTDNAITMPVLAAPVERVITGAAVADAAGVEQCADGYRWAPFADDGDE